MKIDSPCVNICKLDGSGVCTGCFRTLDEIARWSRMMELEKTAIIDALDARRPICGNSCEVPSK